MAFGGGKPKMPVQRRVEKRDVTEKAKEQERSRLFRQAQRASLVKTSPTLASQRPATRAKTLGGI